MQIDPTLRWWLALVVILYLFVLYGIGWFAERRVSTVEDFLVAGRRLPLSLAWMTLLATWFGAGTMLTAADEVCDGGLRRAALDPLGAGVCLLIAGLLLAAPLWRMQLLTLPDFFARKFGQGAELVSGCIMVPSYFGWIAAQFTALAEITELFFGIPTFWGLLLVAIIGTGYTLMGGMWSVVLTDAAQISLVLIGLVVLLVVVLHELGEGSINHGLARITNDTDPESLVLVPRDTLAEFVGWLGVFLIGALGNLPGQDLMQRIFAARSATTARAACLVAGIMYLLCGAAPLILALAGNLLYPGQADTSILPLLANAFLHPLVAVVFLVALLSAILSTIDSAILSPSSVLAQNIFPRFRKTDSVGGNRLAVLLVAACSLVLAYAGDSAYALLEEAYLLTLVGLFVPLMIGLYSRPTDGRAAIVAMGCGTGLWGLHFVAGWETFLPCVPLVADLRLPLSISLTATALVAYFAVTPPWRIHWSRASPDAAS